MISSFGEYFSAAAPVDLRPDALREQVTRTGRALGTEDDRVAASIWFLGAAARLVSPPFGAAVLAGGTDPVAQGRALHDDVVAGAVTELVDAVASTFRVARQILWGDVASGLNGARVVVAGRRPDLAARATAIAGAALAGDLLADAWRRDDAGFRRRTCCLWYRLPAGGLCGDCVLSTTPG